MSQVNTNYSIVWVMVSYAREVSYLESSNVFHCLLCLLQLTCARRKKAVVRQPMGTERFPGQIASAYSDYWINWVNSSVSAASLVGSLASRSG